MRKLILIVLISLIATNISIAHIGLNFVNDNGGHYNYRLGTFHEHFEPGRMYDMDYRLRYFRVGLRTYKFSNGKHAFGFEYLRELGTDRKRDQRKQWGFGINYRRRYSENTTFTYALHYYKIPRRDNKRFEGDINEFEVYDISFLWGIYAPQVSEKLSWHIGMIGSFPVGADDSVYAISNKVEYDMGIAIMFVRYDWYYHMRILSSGLHYKF